MPRSRYCKHVVPLPCMMKLFQAMHVPRSLGLPLGRHACYAFYSMQWPCVCHTRFAMGALKPREQGLVGEDSTGFLDYSLQTCQCGLLYADKEVAYKGAELNDVQLAWASTVHKAQGSECPVVVLVMAPHHRALLSRRLLYTGLLTSPNALPLATPLAHTWFSTLYPCPVGVCPENILVIALGLASGALYT